MLDKDTIQLMEAYEAMGSKRMAKDFPPEHPEEQTIDGVSYQLRRTFDGDVIKVINSYYVSEYGKVNIPENYQEELPEWLNNDNVAEDYKRHYYKLMKWCQLHDAYLFSHGKEESGYFPLEKGIREAIKAGKNIIVYENLS